VTAGSLIKPPGKIHENAEESFVFRALRLAPETFWPSAVSKIRARGNKSEGCTSVTKQGGSYANQSNLCHQNRRQ